MVISRQERQLVTEHGAKESSVEEPALCQHLTCPFSSMLLFDDELCAIAPVGLLLLAGGHFDRNKLPAISGTGH